MKFEGWIGVDLDGTLAHFDGWQDGAIGAPILPMIVRVKRWLREGREVRIFTARVSPGGGRSTVSRHDPDEDFCSRQRALIEEWCRIHLGVVLPVTHEKDWRMAELWDDRAVQVIPNTGVALQDLR